MARIILKSPYYKPSRRAKKLSGMITYIATREGVEKPKDTKENLESTMFQQKVVAEILKQYPDSKDLFEYKDYLKHPTRANADELIRQAADVYAILSEGMGSYVNYIAKRPRAVKTAEHGLFSQNGRAVVLSKVAEEIDSYQGNVWTHIISLKREDAQRLGYDNVEAWQNLLSAKANEIAKYMKIKPENFRWYAAFHNESHHPHVHMIAYSVDPKEAYLSKFGIESIKKALAHEIFKDELLQTYKEQTQKRDTLKADTKKILEDIVTQINAHGFENPVLEQKLIELSKRLSRTKGKKVYGYLKADVKAIVNAIVDELAKDERIAALYDLWYEQRDKILNIYSDKKEERIPLSENKEFKSIKNMVIREAMNLTAEEELANSFSKNFVTESTQNRLTASSLRLFSDVSRLLQEKIRQNEEQDRLHIDRKERQKENAKKQAQGLKQG